MRDTYAAAAVFALLVVLLGWLTWLPLRSGEVVGRYGVGGVTRARSPIKFWTVVTVQTTLALFAAAAAVTLVLSPGR